MERLGRGRRTAWAATALAASVALGACSSTQDVLEPSNITPPQAPLDGSGSAGPTQPASTASTPSPTAPVPAGTRIRFAPIVGPSVAAATSLSERLSLRARERGIGMSGAADQAESYLLRGYFTPLVEGRETTVIFVWDVYDPAGNRVHRISGQEKAPAASGTGWDAVPATTMQAVGDRTIEQFAAWASTAG
jgi:hypothetical protein